MHTVRAIIYRTETIPFAASESTFLVKARMWNPPSLRRKRTTLPPRNPDAPVTAIIGY